MKLSKWGWLLIVAFFILGGKETAWADHGAKSLPTAPQDGALAQGFHFLMIPVDILLAVTYAGGETYTKGQAYKGQYARHGYYRSHARWYDTFLYLHEK